MKKILFTILITLAFNSSALRTSSQEAWLNDMRSLFASKQAIIYAVNIRTFNSLDINKNGIIEEELGEKRGSFINAIKRLDELQAIGINTIHLLPITPVGKTKALGTAGSLYAASSFNEINPQLKEKDSNLSIYEEARKFVDECHKRKIRVIVDLPCCAAYDLYLKNPDLFKKDINNHPIIPSDWTDVRLLDAGTNEKINQDVFNLYKGFIQMAIDLNIDGVVADMASLKPYEFWRKLILQTRESNSQFLFLAQASALWNKPICENYVFTPYTKLLDAGFDGYWGDYFNLKNWKTSKDLISSVKNTQNVASKYKEVKSVIGSFATHDETSPILINGPQFSSMIMWLSATLPLNSYFTDGFTTGDAYIYFWANKKAPKTYTDDEYYFVHRGQPDIFNFSSKPQGRFLNLMEDFVMANKFKVMARELIAEGSFSACKTSSPSVFSYVRENDKLLLLTIGNLDFKAEQEVKVSLPQINPETPSMPIKIMNIPVIEKGRINTILAPGEIQVIIFDKVAKKQIN